MKQYLTMVIVAASVLMMFLTPAPAFAHETNPCAKDFKEVCSDVKPGGGRLARCYEERKDKMSPACQAWAERVKAHGAVLKEACAKELDSWCNFEKGDPYETLDCLRSNYISLSHECLEKFNEFKNRYPKPNPDRSQ
jgi:hypothetical protein